MDGQGALAACLLLLTRSKPNGGSEMAKTERSGHTTTDHDFIRQWVEARGGWPARVQGTGGKNDAGLIRIDFPGFSGEGSLERIEWDEWLEAFDANGLAFLHRDMDHGGGDLDRFNKLVSRSGADDQEEEPEAGGGRRGRSAVASSARKTASRSGSAAAKGGSKSTTASRASSGSKTTASKSSGSRSSSGAASKSSGGSKSSSSSSRGATAEKRSTASSKRGGASETESRSSGGSRSGASRPGASSRSSGASEKSGATAKSGSSAKSGRSGKQSEEGTNELRELLLHEMGDLLSAERQFLVTTRAMVREALDPTVKARAEEHVAETERQIERLREAFGAIGERPKAVKCEAALGLKEEHDSFKSEEKPSKEILSAFGLGSGLRVEHYEIAAYRSTIALASALGEKECAEILKESLEEELAMASFLEKQSKVALRVMAAGEKGGRVGAAVRKVRAAVGM